MVIGQSAPLAAQSFLVGGVLLLLLDFLEWALPGKLLPRPIAATLGEDGVQSPDGFVAWHRVTQIRQVVVTETKEQRTHRLSEERAAKREGRIARRPQRARIAVFDLLDEKPFAKKFAVYPRRAARFIEEANERLARRRRPEVAVESDYRSSSEPVHDHLEDGVLDTALPTPERLAAFLKLDEETQKSTLAAMADKEFRGELRG